MPHPSLIVQCSGNDGYGETTSLADVVSSGDRAPLLYDESACLPVL